MRGRNGLSGVGDVLLTAYGTLPEQARGAAAHQFLDKTGYLRDRQRTDQIMSSTAGPWVKAYLGQINVQALAGNDQKFHQSVRSEMTRFAWVAGGAFILGLIIG
jgi:hypothetical protein